MFERFFFYTHEDDDGVNFNKARCQQTLYILACWPMDTYKMSDFKAVFHLDSPNPLFDTMYFIEIGIKLGCAVWVSW